MLGVVCPNLEAQQLQSFGITIDARSLSKKFHVLSRVRLLACGQHVLGQLEILS